MSITSAIYLGYSSVEELLDGVPSNVTIFVTAVAESHPLGHGISLQQRFVVVSYVSDAGLVHYCRVPTGEQQVLAGGQALDQARTPRVQRWTDDVESIVRTWLHDRGYRAIRSAVPSTPRDLKLLSGTARFLRFDQPSDTFVLVTPDQPAAGEEASRV